MKKLGKTLSLFLALSMLLASLSVTAFADVDSQDAEIGVQQAEEILAEQAEGTIELTQSVSNQMTSIYLPDVTAEMSKASFWINKQKDPDLVLADQDDVDAANQAILYGDGTGMFNIKNWSRETYDGVALNEALVSSATADAQYFWNVGVRFDDEGKRYPDWDTAKAELFDPLINNCVDPEATEQMSVKYGIVTNRTCLLAYPTQHPLYDDPTDPDFNYLYLSLVRVNEPVILRAKSADGKYYQAIASSVSGWISAEDVAICGDKAEWLAAWDLAPEKTLVVYDDKIYTEDSNYAPETANRLLTMGTCLELADLEDYSGLIINRRAYNNHVVYLPVRNEDGSYKKVLALIGENRKVSEGFLPITKSNLISVALNQLGDTYGWGGMLGAEDCSGYVRDVYKCFGLELARNTNGQGNMPVCKYDIAGMDLEEKAERVKNLPPGSILIFRGHEMMYLGEDNGKLYVISSVSDIKFDGSVKRVRGAMINTLDIQRGNNNTWLQEIHTALIPYYLFLFDDVADPAMWYFNDIYNVYQYTNENGTHLMSGYKDTNNFGPTDQLSREQFAVMLHRLDNEPEAQFSPDAYKDVTDPEAFYAAAVMWAKEGGVITGYENGNFGVGDPISREQIATILYRYAKDYKKLDVSAASAAGDLEIFTDAGSVSGFATEAMKWAVGAGILKGNAQEDGTITIDPQGPALRAHIAAMIMRYIDYMQSVSE